MGVKLQAAFNKATSTLKQQPPGENLTGSEGGSQRGGTCGLYSLWYASLMIRTFQPEAPVIWPRARNRPTVAPTDQQSMRHVAKRIAGSGQGEIMNLSEMVQVIRWFKYHYDFSFSGTEKGRKSFITSALAEERPVLLPYLE